MRMFQTFERELILVAPIGFFTYSTLIYTEIRQHQPPLYGEATALASLTLGANRDSHSNSTVDTDTSSVHDDHGPHTNLASWI